MEIHRDSKDVGQVTLKFRRGWKTWHDDGAEGYAGIFVDESSIVGPEYYHPTTSTRDEVLRKVANIFVPESSQSVPS